MDFQVLGPLRVEDAGTEFPLGGPKQRTVLALLAAAAGAPVTMGSLLLQRMLDFADETRPVVRGLALEMLADYSLLLRGDHAAALAACREAARLLVDGGDLDYAAEAESRRAWTHALAGEYARAEEAMHRSDEYHWLIGLPPAAEEHPLLIASIAAGLDRWDDFAAAMRAFFATTPAPSDDPGYEAFLVGEPSTGATFVHMIEPVARWLVGRDRRRAAAAPARRRPHGLRRDRLHRLGTGRRRRTSPTPRRRTHRHPGHRRARHPRCSVSLHDRLRDANSVA